MDDAKTERTRKTSRKSIRRTIAGCCVGLALSCGTAPKPQTVKAPYALTSSATPQLDLGQCKILLARAVDDGNYLFSELEQCEALETKATPMWQKIVMTISGLVVGILGVLLGQEAT